MTSIKQFLKNVPVLGKLLIAAYTVFVRPSASSTRWIRKLLTEKEVIIVQIGSNDGKYLDPLNRLIKRNKGWKVLFVEPVPYLFERLKKTYGTNPRFAFEDVAVNDGSRQMFYSVREEAKAKLPDLPVWFDQLGSFNRQHILDHLDGVLEPYIEETLVSGITLSELLRRNNIQALDLLHIDTEGYDWKILSQLDLNRINPKIILFEHKHLKMPEKQEAINFLKNSYSIFDLGGDFICIRAGSFDKDILKELNPIRDGYSHI